MERIIKETTEKEFVEIIIEFARENRLTIKNVKQCSKLACKEIERNATL
ncbi:MAG: hypothetical protein RR063_12800 [Anaerovoracaceae bacterium]